MSAANPIPMADPAGEYRLLKVEIDAAVSRVLASGRYVLGPEGEALERDVASYVGARYAVGCNSGTDALHLPLVAAGIGAGDEVIVPAFTFFATAEAVSHTGATPVFADIDPGSFNLCVDSLSRKITEKTRAVIAVHLFGQCADLGRIVELCRGRGLLLIEDCAQALGAAYQGRRAGAWGDFGCFSFYPTKNLAAVGDAGMITTSNPGHDSTLRMLRHHGSRQTYLHERVGWNSRLDEIQAAVLRVKLRRLGEWTTARRRLAARYRELLAGLPLELPVERPPAFHVYHQFTVRVPRRDEVARRLAELGIGTTVHYPITIPAQPLFCPPGGAAKVAADFPESTRAAREVLSLPCFPELTDAELAEVAAALRIALG